MTCRGAIATFFALGLAGCSFMMPSPQYAQPQEELRCGARSATTVLDTLMAIASIGGATGVFIADASRDCSDSDFCLKGIPSLIIGVPALALGALYVVSAVYGSHREADCREHNELLARSRDPNPGAVGHFCQPGSTLWTCEPGSICQLDRCVPEGGNP
jgi:hypothetical protein